MNKLLMLIVAGASGALSVLGWAPFGWWGLPLLGYGVLFWLLCTSRTAWQAGWLGLFFGAALHLTGHGWIMHALHDKIGMALVPAALSTLMFVFYLALFSALPCFIWRLIAGHKISASATDDTRPGLAGIHPFTCLSAIAAFAALLALGEWARSIFFNGFTSLSLGYGLVPTWLGGYAPVFGLYAVSWFGYCIGGLIGYALVGKVGGRLVATAALIAIAGIAAVLNGVAWAQPFGTPLSYRLIQSNTVQQRKFDPAYKQEHIRHLVQAIEQRPADMIVTAETDFPVFLNQLPSLTLHRLQQFSDRTESHLFLGIATSAADGEGHNSMLQIAPHQTTIAQYDKVKLMPFGEYSPVGFGWFAHSLNIALKDLAAGSVGQQAFVVGSQRIGTLICHEDLVGQNLRHWMPAATVLINPSNLAWFENSLAIGQGLQIAQMRALEAGRPILRIANAGITAHIDPHGKVVDRVPEQQQQMLAGRVQPMQGQTPYVSWGNGPILSACYLFLLLFWWIRHGSSP